MPKTLIVTLWCGFLLVGMNPSLQGQTEKLRAQDFNATDNSDKSLAELKGPIRRVRVETAQMLVNKGTLVEGPRVLRGIATYDQKGGQIDLVTYPSEDSTRRGNTQYRYDDEGNIVELVLLGDDGSILSKMIFKYELDEIGNWKKMISEIAVYENGLVKYEPIEVTYRTITYYYGQAVDRFAAVTSNAHATAPLTSTIPVSSSPRVAAIAPSDSARTNEPESSASDENGLSSVDSKVTNVGAKDSSAATPDKQEDKRIGEGDLPISHKYTSSPGSASISPISTAARTTSSLEPESSSVYEKGLRHLAAGRHAEAVEALKQSVALNPNDAIAYVKLGMAHSGLRQYKETVVALKKAIRLKAEIVDALGYYHLGYAYASLDRPLNAVEAFKQALYITRAESADPTKGSLRRPLPLEDLHYNLGLVYYNLARYNDAIRAMKEVVKLNSGVAEAYYGLAAAYLAVHDIRSAQKQVAPLSALNPELANRLRDAIAGEQNVHSFRRNVLLP